MAISKRALLAEAVDRSGLRFLLQRMARKPLLLVINYHRLGNPARDCFDAGVFSATAAAFEAQVSYLRDNFRVLSNDDLLQLAADKFKVREMSAMITFDDGYADNFHIGFPILAKYGVTATFFVATDYLDRPRLPWWDRISYIVNRTAKQELTLHLQPPLHIDLRLTSRKEACLQLLHYYKTRKQVHPDLFFQHLQDQAEVVCDAEGLGRKLFMSWGQVKKMAAAGMGIGSHTHSHEILAHLTEKEERRELEISKKRLEQRLRHPIYSLSYPVGKRAVSFTERTKRNAAAAGYRIAFSFDHGINLPPIQDPFDIQRVGVGVNDMLPMFRTRTMFNSFGKIF